MWSRHIVRLISFCAKTSAMCKSILRHSTYGHGELVVREEARHQVEEVFIVLAEDDSFERDLRKQRLEPGWELALDVPTLLRNGLLEDIDGLLEIGMEGMLDQGQRRT